jgi:hypothetical protein
LLLLRRRRISIAAGSDDVIWRCWRRWVPIVSGSSRWRWHRVTRRGWRGSRLFLPRGTNKKKKKKRSDGSERSAIAIPTQLTWTFGHKHWGRDLYGREGCLSTSRCWLEDKMAMC